MKGIIAFITLYCVSVSGFGQMFSVSADKMNVMYWGVANPITVSVENLTCKSISITVNNGTIEKKDNCHYDIWPATRGIMLIDIYKNIGGNKEMIGEVKYRVRSIPDPIPIIGGSVDGEIKKDILCSQTGMIANLNNFDFDARFVIKGFKVVILKGSTLAYSEDNEGNRFEEKVVKRFKTLEDRDVVIFTNIIATGPEGILRNLNPILLTIKD